MRIHDIAIAPALAVGAVLLAALPARAQFGAPAYPGLGGRLVVEAFLSEHRSADGTSGTRRQDGVGGRVLWYLAEGGARTGITSRLALGPFLVRTDDAGASAGSPQRRSVHAGVELSARTLAAPLGGRVDPVLSFAVGAFHMREAPARPRELPWLVVTDLPRRFEQPAAFADQARARTSTSLALTPGIGVRLRVLPGLALRADLRDAVVFRAGPRHFVELIGGVSLTR
jgi:hypothetical protein